MKKEFSGSITNHLYLICSVLLFTIDAHGQSLSFEEQLLNTTVQILHIKGDSTFTGTGFVYSVGEGDKSVELLVTNKHVVDRADTTIIRVNTVDSRGNYYGNVEEVYFTGFKDLWSYHPSSNVDLCAMPWSIIKNVISSRQKELFYRSIPSSLVPPDSIWNSLTILEDITMIGYPKGLVDSYNNTAIARVGVTATQPKLDFENQPYFLIDIAAYGGSSGSPVLLRQLETYYRRTDNIISSELRYNYQLLGVLFAGPMVEKYVNGTVRSILVDSNDKQTFPINIGIVVKASELSYFESVFVE